MTRTAAGQTPASSGPPCLGRRASEASWPCPEYGPGDIPPAPGSPPFLRRTTSRRSIATATCRRPPVVLLIGNRRAMAAPGGGEVQMLALAAALRSAAVAARISWQAEGCLAGADCVHLFGSLPEHVAAAQSARRRGLPVVLSTIAWFELANCWREPKAVPGRLAASARFLARAAVPRLPSWRRRLYHAVDLLLPNSHAEADQLKRYFQVPSRRICVVPNGADPGFAAADPGPFSDLLGRRGFVLCAGRIEPRKNQLGLLKAMRGTDVPIVILGDVVPGHEPYLAACRGAAGAYVQFVPRIEQRDPLLASAYAACGCLVLPGWFETPGLAALEAGMSGTPLVLPEGGCAREYFGPLAEYVRPNDLPGIRRAVLRALARARSKRLAELVRENFTWTQAARATRHAYDKVL